MPITVTISISEPDTITGDARHDVLNSIAQTLEVLGPEWTHIVTYTATGTIEIRYTREQKKG